ARLALPPRPAASLHVIGRCRRHVAEMDEVEIGDVDAELHRRRADQIGKPAAQFGFLARVVLVPPEAPLAPSALARRHDLGRVLASLQGCERRWRLPIETLEERIDRRRQFQITAAAGAARVERVERRRAAIPRLPKDAAGIELIQLMIVDRIEPREHSLAHQEHEEGIDELRVIVCRQTYPLTQEPAERTALTKPKPIDGTIRV